MGFYWNPAFANIAISYRCLLSKGFFFCLGVKSIGWLDRAKV